MTTHAIFTAPNSDGIYYSLRSDQTLWHYNAVAGWTQVATQTQIDAVLWQAAAQGYAASVAMSGFATAEGESGGAPPPPPPQV